MYIYYEEIHIWPEEHVGRKRLHVDASTPTFFLFLDEIILREQRYKDPYTDLHRLVCVYPLAAAATFLRYIVSDRI